MRRAHIDGGDHVGHLGFGGNIEPTWSLAQRNCRSKRPKGFSHLDHRIDPISHPWMTRVSQYAPMPQCSRPELHPFPIPSDHIALSDQTGCLFAGLEQIVELSHLDLAGTF